MFLEENTTGVEDCAFLTCLSFKPLNAFRALCAGVELQRVDIFGETYRGSWRNCIRYTCEVSKTKDGLKVVFPDLYQKEGEFEPCGCRIESLASLYGKHDHAIVRFLFTLREDWVNVAYKACAWSEHNPE
jgi:hypothetical protein